MRLTIKNDVLKNRYTTLSDRISSNSIRTYKKTIFFVLCFIVFLVYFCSDNIIEKNSRWINYHLTKDNETSNAISNFRKRITNDDIEKLFETSDENEVRKQPGYLVYEQFCKIPSVDPFDPSIMQYFERRTYEQCTTNVSLTFVKYNSDIAKYELHFDIEKLNENETLDDWQCCFKEIIRPNGSSADSNYELSECHKFNDSIVIEPKIEFISVNCKNLTSNNVHKNIISMIPEKIEVIDRYKKYENNFGYPTSVFMVGIDSMSRANLLRSMPNTVEFLYGMNNQWFDMEGYNKIGDNTFPNLMAVLAGLNCTTYEEICNGKEVGGLDKCPFVWKLFEKYGYATAYAEDDFIGFSTFNYLKKGFLEKPVDYYLRPLIVSTKHELPVKEMGMSSVCVGLKHQTEYVLDYNIEFVERFKNESYFGLFWFNLFSHDGFDYSSEMDGKMLQYFKDLKASGIMEKSIIIFFSDHGMRWGHGNNFYEERLPFLYIWLPPKFKNQNPKIVKALTINQNRLINPFDLHITLKNIIELSGRVEGGENTIQQAPDCLKCQSIFKEIPKNRTCEDIAIEDHWCTCNPFEAVDVKKKLIQQIGQFSVEYINSLIQNHINPEVRNQCRSNIELKSIVKAYILLPLKENNKNIKLFRIIFDTETSGHEDGNFFATVKLNLNTGVFDISGEISRLNSYAEDAYCISVLNAKMYCFCNKVKN